MQLTVHPGTISGTATAPASKSMTQRAYAAALLHRGKTIIHNAGDSNDEIAALTAIQALSAEIERNAGQVITINSKGIAPATKEVFVGESGLAARLFIPIASLASTQLTISGAGTLLNRPLNGVKSGLEALGVNLLNFNNFLPVTLQGPIQPTDITIDASGGSQFVSGLLFALSHAALAPVKLTVHKLTSKPYVDMTLQMLERCGKPISHKNYKEFYIDPSRFTNTDELELNVEGDWSGAANLLVAGAVAGDVSVRNLDTTSKQADRAIYDILKETGAPIGSNASGIIVKSARLRAFEYDATDTPDLFPILAILAANCIGDSRITGVHRLFNKESNRAESISEMLEAFNVPFSIEDDALCVEGVQKLRGTVIDSYNDHRIVMAAAIGALNASGPVDIRGADAVNKSYPGFFNTLSLLGVNTAAS
jgi:3-phosphoshikimate 1-carboxyvinyltransferase